MVGYEKNADRAVGVVPPLTETEPSDGSESQRDIEIPEMRYVSQGLF